MTEPWSGQWAADRLAARLITDSAGPLRLTDLVGLAIRRNPRRAQLLVSTVLGKHLPADPRVVYGAGRLLGALVADCLAGRPSVLAERGPALLRRALSDDPDAATALLSACAEHARGVRVPAVVLGFAETATALGHSVSDALGADYLHSTRRDDGGWRAASFQEEHSHASDHLLLPGDPALLRQPGALVLVDDELSTGRTAGNTIRALHREHPERRHYLIATLVDLRPSRERAQLAELGRELGVRVSVVALSAGRLKLPADVLQRGEQLLREHHRQLAPAGPVAAAPPAPAARWPASVAEGGRHGFRQSERDELERGAAECAAGLVARLGAALGRRRVLVLGTEELLYAPLRIALALAASLPGEAGRALRFASTTRSPVLAVDDPGYPIRTVLEFAAHDRPADGPGRRFAYNVAAGTDMDRRFTDLVLVLDGATRPAELAELRAALAGQVERVHEVWITARRRPVTGPGVGLPSPLAGPEFGSYQPAEVRWLLTDLSAVALEAPIEQREAAIQAGQAHYSESLPIEYQPSARYQQLYRQALADSAATVAAAVGTVSELILAERGHGAVLVSLARAGTPVGALIRRWALRCHGLDLPHYSISIVRGRGLDQVALQYLASQHDPSQVMFIDGWTGKGAIATELAAALASANRELGLPAAGGFADDLAVLADPGGCARLFGTREDFLIPSACLNSTVSGLVSRTVLNRSHLGPHQFHGAKYYRELADADVSGQFLDAISDRFEQVRPQVLAGVAALDRGRPPNWQGSRTVRELADRFGVTDLNLIKPGVGETTRVLLRRVPWKVLLRRDAAAGLAHLVLLAEQRGVEIELVDELGYRAIGLIQPGYRAGGE